MRRIQTASYGYASFLKTEEQRKAREELADELMRFVNEAFGEDKASDSAKVILTNCLRDIHRSHSARQ